MVPEKTSRKIGKIVFLLTVQCTNNDETIDLKIQIVDQPRSRRFSLLKIFRVVCRNLIDQWSQLALQPFINIIWGQSQRFWEESSREDLTSKADFTHSLLKLVWQNKYNYLAVAWMPKCKIDLNDNRKPEMPLRFSKIFQEFWIFKNVDSFAQMIIFKKS